MRIYECLDSQGDSAPGVWGKANDKGRSSTSDVASHQEWPSRKWSLSLVVVVVVAVLAGVPPARGSGWHQ